MSTYSTPRHVQDSLRKPYLKLRRTHKQAIFIDAHYPFLDSFWHCEDVDIEIAVIMAKDRVRGCIDTRVPISSTRK